MVVKTLFEKQGVAIRSGSLASHSAQNKQTSSVLDRLVIQSSFQEYFCSEKPEGSITN
jgi:hypothetical protein